MSAPLGYVTASVLRATTAAAEDGGVSRTWSTVWTGRARLRRTKRLNRIGAAAGEVHLWPYLLVLHGPDRPDVSGDPATYRVTVGGRTYYVADMAEYAATTQMWLEDQE